MTLDERLYHNVTTVSKLYPKYLLQVSITFYYRILLIPFVLSETHASIMIRN